MMDKPWKRKVLAHDDVAPRYTSYPPATAFSRGFSPDTPTGWLRAMPDEGRLSLYVHIPFCAQLCYYCGCHTNIANDNARIQAYLENLYAEIITASRLVKPGVRVTHLHFGGGSPTMLKDADFSALMERLRHHFSFHADAEIAIEADPRQMTKERIMLYRQCGMTRLSLGVQDFDQKVLESVNRPQPYALTENAVSWAREAGIGGINFDIMYGLPHQTLETMRDTLEKAIGLNPQRIAFFGYAHVPWMKKHMSVMDVAAMPDTDLRYDLFMSGKKILEEAGYRMIGIDHFVREDDTMARAWREGNLRRNFQGYTTDTADALLGLGASAISAFPQGYAQNTTDIRMYADQAQAGRLPVARGYFLSALDRARADIIMHIMCDMHVDLADIAQAHELAADYFDMDLQKLDALRHDGLLTIEGRRIAVHPDARLLARLVARAFDAFSIDADTPRHVRSV